MFTPETYLPPPTATYTYTPSTKKMRTYTITGYREDHDENFSPYREQVIADDFKQQLSEGRATFFIEGKAVAFFEGIERVTSTALD